MKIGMISNSWRPVRCGVTTVLEEAATHLCAKGHEVVFIAPDHPGHTDDEWPELRLPSIAVQTDYRAFAPWAGWVPSTWRSLRSLGCDIIHAHDSLPFGAGFLGVLIRRRLKIPLVITQHCFYEAVAVDHCRSRPGGRLLAAAIRPPLRAAMRRVLGQADLVLAPSEAAAGDVRRFRPEGAQVLPSGVCVPEPRPNGEMRRRLGLTNGKRMLLNVGRLHADKNLFVLLDAFARSARVVPDTILVVIGDGPLRLRLERRARELGTADRVLFPGLVPHHEIWGWYAAADLLVSTSCETQGLVFLEAMHMGVPVVAVNEGGAGSVIRHEQDGLLVSGAPEAVSGAITRCLHDHELHARMSQQARQRAAQFDSRALVAKLESYYVSILARPDRAHSRG